MKQVEKWSGFICSTKEEKQRIWNNLKEAGYPMYLYNENYENNKLGIYWNDTIWDCSDEDSIFIEHPLSESEFFEWTPKQGELVELSYNGETWFKRVFVVEWKGRFWTETDFNQNELIGWKHIRQIKPEEMTLEEAQEKLRELLKKPNLIIK